MENRVKKITIIFENVKLFLNSEAIQKDKLVPIYGSTMFSFIICETGHKTFACKCFVVWKKKHEKKLFVVMTLKITYFQKLWNRWNDVRK